MIACHPAKAGCESDHFGKFAGETIYENCQTNIGNLDNHSNSVESHTGIAPAPQYRLVEGRRRINHQTLSDPGVFEGLGLCKVPLSLRPAPLLFADSAQAKFQSHA